MTYKIFQFLIKILMKKHIFKENYNKIYLARQLHGNADVIGNKTNGVRLFFGSQVLSNLNVILTQIIEEG